MIQINVSKNASRTRAQLYSGGWVGRSGTVGGRSNWKCFASPFSEMGKKLEDGLPVSLNCGDFDWLWSLEVISNVIVWWAYLTSSLMFCSELSPCFTWLSRFVELMVESCSFSYLARPLHPVQGEHIGLLSRSLLSETCVWWYTMFNVCEELFV